MMSDKLERMLAQWEKAERIGVMLPGTLMTCDEAAKLIRSALSAAPSGQAPLVEVKPLDLHEIEMQIGASVRYANRTIRPREHQPIASCCEGAAAQIVLHALEECGFAVIRSALLAPASAETAEGWWSDYKTYECAPVAPPASTEPVAYMKGDATTTTRGLSGDYLAKNGWTPLYASPPASGAVGGWQDIASNPPPKDGKTWILLRGRNAVGHPMIPVVAAWMPAGSPHLGWVDSGSFKPIDNLVSDKGADWMSLPASPAGEG